MNKKYTQGYDNGGAYWDDRLNGNKIYCAMHDNLGRLFIDAQNREEAKKQILKEWPNAKFFRQEVDMSKNIIVNLQSFIKTIEDGLSEEEQRKEAIKALGNRIKTKEIYVDTVEEMED